MKGKKMKVCDKDLIEHFLLKRRLLESQRDTGEISSQEFDEEHNRMEKVSNILLLRISREEMNTPKHKELELAYQELLKDIK
jgi:hemerythrin